MPEFLKNSLVKAGAGTGKTECLINSVYEVFQKFTLAKGREPKLIVCTFTKKASQELKERLFKISLEELKKFSQVDTELKAPAFLNYLQSSFLQVSTIDGILNHFLKKQGSFIDLNPDFEISYSPVNEELFDSLAEKFIYDKYFSLLQKFHYPILRDIFISYFNNRLKYKNISFYDKEDFKEFTEDRNRILSLIETKSSFEPVFKANPCLSLLDSENLKKWVKQEEKFCEKEFLPVFEELKKAGEELFPLFLENKKNSAVLKIEDLLLFSHHLLHENPLAVRTFSEQWDYWFIDEYQDTSWLQEQVIQQLTKFKNVFCVGDPGQSIYSFREADPQVFHRREQELKAELEVLTTNHRSSSQLISFYNDFFTKEPFIKFKAYSPKKLSSVDPYLSFFTYSKKEKEYQDHVLKSLLYHIQNLKAQGVDYGEIAVLSSRNEDVAQITNYLRDKNLPVILHSSKKISKNRIVLDSLFLLKFLINPYDDINLKALLRTPYFKLKDQNLADSSYQYSELKNQELTDSSHQQNSQEDFLSFWSFIKDKYKKTLFVKQLTKYLDNYKKLGLFESFKQALFDSSLMDLSYWQDPSSFSTANVWKLINLLYNKKFSELKLFYELLEQEEKAENLKLVQPYEKNSSISLMTIHKSKGLEFGHVILLDFSIDDSSFQTGRKLEEITVFDKKRNKMAVAVHIGGREKKKFRSYGHEIYNQEQKQIKKAEKERLYYVAMTRAKDSLTIFLPHDRQPKRNSWLKEVDYFHKVKGLLYKDEAEKIWLLNSGVYQKGDYSLTVKECNVFNKETQLIAGKKIKSQVQKTSLGLCDRSASSNEQVSSSQSIFPKANVSKLSPKALSDVQSKTFPQADDINLSDRKLKNSAQNKSYSSKDFIQFITQPESHEKSDFSFKKTKNILFKSSLGSQLHFFLQKLFYFPFEKVEHLINVSPFLSKEDQERIKQALVYIKELKEPKISSCFKTGFSEWSFQLQREEIILKGQIDLWSWIGNEIYLFDYKSAVSKNVKNQLIFYSWILDQIYQAKAIWMYECYPLEEKTKKTLYQPQHKELFESWFMSL